jgi:uncharacterized membrane protein (DUF106 family)
MVMKLDGVYWANVKCQSSRNYQQYALIVQLLYFILAPTCFGSSLPPVGKVLDASELLGIQIEWVVYYIMCGYVTTHMLYHPFDLYFK